MFLLMSLTPLASTMIAVAIPSISEQLELPAATVTHWLVLSYLLIAVTFNTPAGRIADLIGHKRGLVIGALIFAAGASLGSMVSDLVVLTVARALMAAGGAISGPSTLAIIRNLVSVERRPLAFGLFGTVMGSAAAVGPLVGGPLTVWFGWQAVFLVNLPLIGAGLLLFAVAGKQSKMAVAKAGRGRFDFAGTLLLMLTLGLLFIALRDQSGFRLGLFVLSAIAGAAFLATERIVKEPVLQLRLFARRAFTAGGLLVALQNLAMYSLLFQLPVFFEQNRDATSTQVGLAIASLTVAMFSLSLAGGALMKWIGARVAALTGALLTLAGWWLLHDLAAFGTPAEAIPALLCVGAGIGISTSPCQTAAMNACDSEYAGMAGGVLSTMRYLGGFAGIAILSAVTLADGRGVATVAQHQRMMPIYGVALAACVLLSLLLPGRGPRIARS